MDVLIFSLLSITAIILLGISFNIKKVTNFWLYSLIAAILFATLALSALNVSFTECENQVTFINETAITENYTEKTLTNTISCTTENTEEIGLAALNSVLSLFAFVWTFISPIAYKKINL